MSITINIYFIISLHADNYTKTMLALNQTWLHNVDHASIMPDMAACCGACETR